MSCLRYQHNELFIEDIALRSVAERFQTPCYVYSTAQLMQNWRAFQHAFADIAHQICYAVKANGNISLLRMLVEANAGFDIVSIGELERVLTAGGDPKKVVFSGVGKTNIEIECAIQHGIFCFDVESISEIHRLQMIAAQLNRTVDIALRVNPNVDPRTHAHISTGLKENKFGIDIDEVIPLAQQLEAMPALRLIGLACHIGSQITDIDPFLSALDQLLKVYSALATTHTSLRHINLGGGLGIIYQHETPPTIQAYAAAIKSKLTGHRVELILEPGRALIANAGVLLTRVEYLKHTSHKNFAIVDAGMNDLLRPALYDAWQNILPVYQRTGTTQAYDIAGPVCESADFLGRNRLLTIEEGDLLAIDCAGAYGFSMSSNYNTRCRAAEVLIDGHSAKLIRRRETLADVFATEIMLEPSSLSNSV